MEIIFLALRKRVITDSGSRNLVGLILYGTKKLRNDNGFENVVELHSFGGIDVSRIHDVKNMARDPNSLLAKFEGPADAKEGDSALDRALWLCNFCFAGAKLKPFDEQKIWLFTNNDAPHCGNELLRAKLLKRIEDLFQASQTLNVWPMVSAARFDQDKFFKAALAQADAAVPATKNEVGEEFDRPKSEIFWADGVSHEDLKDFVRRKDFAKRKLAPVKMDLGNGIKLGLDLFPLLMRATLPNPQKLDANSQEVVRSATQYICSESLKVLTPDQIETFYQLGVDMRVFVKREEVRILKRFGPPASFTFLGFKPAASLKPWYAVRPPYFVVPSEKSVEGSTVLFNALLKVMGERKLAMFAVGTLRTGEACKLFALLPRQERLNEHGEVLDDAGMDVIVLPWSNDIRRLQLDPVPEDEKDVPKQLVDKARALVTAMEMEPKEETGRFYPFQNPHLQKHYACLESVALRNAGQSGAPMEWDPEEDDETLPQLDAIADGKPARAIQAFLEALGGGPESEDEVDRVAKELKKRKAATTRAAAGGRAGSAPAAKRQKQPAVDPANWREAAAEGRLAKLTVAQLKAICKDNELAVSGSKQFLLDRLEALLEDEGGAGGQAPGEDSPEAAAVQVKEEEEDGADDAASAEAPPARSRRPRRAARAAAKRVIEIDDDDDDDDDDDAADGFGNGTVQADDDSEDEF